MAKRNYNNTTGTAQLVAPAAPSDVFLSVTGLTNPPAAPFTATVDRNTGAEEVVLVTAVNGGSLTVTRGFNGTAAQTHLAGATVEHTAVALDFTEANAHVNATTGAHGTTGDAVGTEGAQTLLDKTLTAPMFEADAAMGDAVTAWVPTGVNRDLFRGLDGNGNDVFVVDKTGHVTGAPAATSGQFATKGQVDAAASTAATNLANATGPLTTDVNALKADTGWVNLTVPAPLQAGGFGAAYRQIGKTVSVVVDVFWTGTYAAGQVLVSGLPAGNRNAYVAGMAYGGVAVQLRTDHAQGRLVNHNAMGTQGGITATFTYTTA